MKLKNFRVKMNFSRQFRPSDKEFQKLFGDAIKVNPSKIAFDLDFKFEGMVGEAMGVQIEQSSMASGDFSVVPDANDLLVLKAAGDADIELMFFNDAHLSAFETSLKGGSLKIAIASICNNGGNRKTFWSMACEPALELDSAEARISEA
jgi:hypothetical protein